MHLNWAPYQCQPPTVNVRVQPGRCILITIASVPSPKPFCPAPARLSLFSKFFYKADILYSSFNRIAEVLLQLSCTARWTRGHSAAALRLGDGSFIADHADSKKEDFCLPLTLLLFQPPLPIPLQQYILSAQITVLENTSLSPSLFPVSSPGLQSCAYLQF